VRLKEKDAYEEETASKENEIDQPREQKARRDKPKGRGSIEEVWLHPAEQAHDGAWSLKSAHNLMVLRFQSPSM